MRRSVAEPRADGKASPLVGAVLVRSDGQVSEGARGELRHGDHAEFTVLERKNRDQPLDGSVLFATLEPCAPGARRHPKLGCAERIVNARIAEVWIGIEDPDPTVARKGLEFLRQHGVVVHLFDQDLQEQITEANQDFLAQARARSVEAESEPVRPSAPVLSSLEAPLLHLTYQDLDASALEHYRQKQVADTTPRSPEFLRRLTLDGLFVETDRGLNPTRSGWILLAAEPARVVPQARLSVVLRRPNRPDEVVPFHNPFLDIVDAFMDWLRTRFDNPADRSRGTRRSVNEAFYTLVREGLVNALVHRDYDLAGAGIRIVIWAEGTEVQRLDIESPGAPVHPLTVEQISRFEAPSLSRNPVLNAAFTRQQLSEQAGLGMNTFRQTAQEAGLPLPSFEWDDPYLVLKLFRTPEAAVASTVTDVRLNEDERAGLAWLSTQDSVSKAEYAEQMGFDEKKAQRHLNRFVELGLVSRSGRTRGTRFSFGSAPSTDSEEST
ncbi:MAG: hypothetical protein LCH53_12200 [Bacteroidetes bacterium]|nr:hypothetical protein [Bacteroidota bacterium]